MGLTRLALRRPVTMLMILLSLAMAGLFAYTRLPVRRLPSVHFPFVQVRITDPGASPIDVERNITLPVENAVSTVGGIVTLNGTSILGQSRLAIRFAGGTNVSTAANAVAQAVGRIAGALPAGIPSPSIIQANPSAAPILDIALSGTPSATELSNYAANVLVPDLQAVPGVANVQVTGGQVPEINVLLSPNRLAALGVPLSAVQSAITQSNLSVPAGMLNQGRRAAVARTRGTVQSPQSLGNLRLPTVGTGAPVYLRDVATIQEGVAPPSRIAFLNGQSAVGVAITARSDANSLSVARGIQSVLGHLSGSLPPGTRLAVIGDTTVYTQQALASVQQDLLLAVLLAGLTLLLFLKRMVNTLIVVLAIPASLLSTFLIMYFLGFSLDLISLMALSLVIGILVDDAIVVLENITRHLQRGENPEEAALKGRSEIGLAAIAITLTDVVVYAPMIFVTGNIGQIFREFGLTITIATLFSLFISFTLTPLLASRWLRPPAEEGAGGGLWRGITDRFEVFYHGLEYRYRRLLAWALRHRLAVVSVAFLSLAASGAFVPLGLVGTTYVPSQDTGVLIINARMPVDSSLTATEGAVATLGRNLLHLPAVARVFTSVGYGGGTGGISTAHNGQITVDLKPRGQRRVTVFAVAAQARQLAAGIPGLAIQTNVQNPLVAAGSRPLTIALTGPNPVVLDPLATHLAARVAHVPGAVEVSTTAAAAQPELAVQPQRPLLAAAGLTTATLAHTVQAAVQGVQAGFFRPALGVLPEPIILELSGGSTTSTSALEHLPLATSRGTVLLGQVARVVQTGAPVSIVQRDRQMVVSVTANVTGIPLGTVAAHVRNLLLHFPMPPGYTWHFGGVVRQQGRAFGPLFQSLLLSILLVYMLMASLYESFLQPLAVMLAVPLATIGAFLGLLVTGNTLNIYSFIGLIMLMGLVAKNAILLVDYANTLRRRGLPRQEALLLAGPTRLRPILMTTVTMVFAMLPLALRLGAGSSQRAPMAVVVVGGLITSTLLTLLVVPAMYTYVDDLQAWLFQKPASSPKEGVTLEM